MESNLNDLEEVGKLIDAQASQTIELLKGYGFVPDTNEWLTIRSYAKKYGVPEDVVNGWIAEGVIPANAVQDLPEVHHLRLIIDQVYKRAQ